MATKISLTAIAALIAGLLAAQGAAIGMPTYGKAFCEGRTLHDYERVLEQLPPVRKPPEQLPFGPRNLSFYSAAFSRVVVGKGGFFGYGFFDETYRSRVLDLDWDVTTTLTRVGRRGGVIRTVATQHRYLGVVENIGEERGLSFSVPATSALYRYGIEFRDHASGEALGSYAEYFRVVKPTYHVRLGIDRTVFRPGQTAYARVENRGSVWAGFGLGFDIQHLGPSGWRRDPASPSGLVPAVLVAAKSGTAGWCMRFRIPPDLAPGRYRFAKGMGALFYGRQGGTETVGFRVLPAR
jgi:hypothetical protein